MRHLLLASLTGLLVAAQVLARAEYPYADQVRRAAQRYGVEEALVRAVIQAESSFDPRALSHKGAAGLMQLMVPTARQYEPRATASLLRRDPGLNVDIGTRHLRTLDRQVRRRYPAADAETRRRLVAAAYNAGWSRVVAAGGRVPAIAETRAYVGRVERFYRSYGGKAVVDGPGPAALPAIDRRREGLKLAGGLGGLLALQGVWGWGRLAAMRRRRTNGNTPYLPPARRIP